MDEDYRDRKIDFVTGWTGSSLLEINQVTLVAPAAALLWAVLQSRQKFFEPYSLVGCVADFIIHVGAILFACTAYADSPVTLIGFLLLPAIVSIMTSPEPEPKKAAKPPVKDEQPVEEAPLDFIPVKPFITTYRGAMMIITCVCILAVDFPIFPRRFAKVENWGTSLMDLGVGSFVFSMGVISVRQQLKDAHEGAVRSSFIQRFKNSLRHSLPLIALGLVRVWSVKGLDYQEHVTEYGVHWNFFFTLGLIPPFVTIFQSLFKLIPSYCILGFAIGVLYEMSFIYTDLAMYFFTAERVDFLSSNREGVFSLIGYLAIFLCGMGVGMPALKRDVDSFTPISENDEWIASVLGGDEEVRKVREQREHNTLISLAKWSGIWIATYVMLTNRYYGPRLTESRRVTNLAYICWVAAFNTTQLFLFRAIEGISFPLLNKARNKRDETEMVKGATSKLLQAFNRNGLAIFLLANLLTGAVNMTLPTLDMGDVESMAVLVGYMGALAGVALLLDHLNISIKL